MKKLLFVIVAALAFVACEKEEQEWFGVKWNKTSSNYVVIKGEIYPYLNPLEGDNMVMTVQQNNSYVSLIILDDYEGNEIIYKFSSNDSEYDFEIGSVKKLSTKGWDNYSLSLTPNAENKYKAVFLQFISQETNRTIDFLIYLNKNEQ